MPPTCSDDFGIDRFTTKILVPLPLRPRMAKVTVKIAQKTSKMAKMNPKMNMEMNIKMNAKMNTA